MKIESWIEAVIRTASTAQGDFFKMPFLHCVNLMAHNVGVERRATQFRAGQLPPSFPIRCNEQVHLQRAQWRRTAARVGWGGVGGQGRLWSLHHIFFLSHHQYFIYIVDK